MLLVLIYSLMAVHDLHLLLYALSYLYSGLFLALALTSHAALGPL
jgi:hypothetical protein